MYSKQKGVGSMYDMELKVNLTGLRWESDWNGHEVGYPEVAVAGYYSKEMDDGEGALGMYIDTANGVILDIWPEEV